MILAGDFNDFPYSAAAEELNQVGLVNLMNSFPGKPQYTFIYKGVSQVLDQIFVSPKIVDTAGELLIARVLHIGADYPAVFEADASRKQRASDHDPVLVRKIRMTQQTFFPLITLGHHFP